MLFDGCHVHLRIWQDFMVFVANGRRNKLARSEQNTVRYVVPQASIVIVYISVAFGPSALERATMPGVGPIPSVRMSHENAAAHTHPHHLEDWVSCLQPPIATDLGTRLSCPLPAGTNPHYGKVMSYFDRTHPGDTLNMARKLRPRFMENGRNALNAPVEGCDSQWRR